MNASFRLAILSGVIALLCGGASAQEPAAGSTVPRLISFGGVLKDAAGKPVSGAVGVTFSLFAEQAGGSALWSETQVVDADAQGHYSVFLGATDPAGLPLGLFTSGAARWLAVEPDVPSAVTGSRILLVGVPYALKAADADTLGGKPASAFAMAAPQAAQAAAPAVIEAVTPAGVSPAATPTGSGTTDYVPLWTSSTTLGNSLLFQSGTSIEVEGTLELPSVGTATTSAGYDSRPFDLFASVYNSSSKAAVAQHFRWEAEPVSNDTSTASGKLDLLYGSGTSTPAETGLSIGSKGVLTFASGQTFPGTGPGTITGVTAGTDLTGGGTSGKVTLNVDTTKVPQLNTANSFTGNQTVTGNISASGTISATGQISTSNNLLASGFVSGASGLFTTDGVLASAPALGLLSYETGNSNGDIAVEGYAVGDSAQTFGVYGYTASANGFGVYGQLVGPSSEGTSRGYASAVWGDTGVKNTIAVQGTADDGAAGEFFNNSEPSYSLAAVNDFSNNGTYGYAFYAGGSGGSCQIYGSGELSCTGSKSAVVPVDGGNRKVALYAVEAPENWFEDFGSGQLSNGVARVQLEPTFAQTVNATVEYHVFLTPKGESKGWLYVTNESPAGFEVREAGGGQSNIAFDYRIVARRKGYETIRLADKTKEFDPSRRPHRDAKRVPQPAAAKPATAAEVHR